MKKGLAHFFILIFAPVFAYAAVMQSTHYQIATDSLNNAGTEKSSSTSYRVSDTVGETATGRSTSANYNLSAGYRALGGSYISLSAPSDITMSPELNGIIQNESAGEVEFTVITDSSAGYTLSVRTLTDPSLKSVSDSFLDYGASTTPDYEFSVTSGSSAFGYSVFGDDAAEKFHDNTLNACGSAYSSRTFHKCWVGFSTVDSVVAQGAVPNHPSGKVTTMSVRAENGSSHMQSPGTYQTTVIATAIAL